MNNHSIPFFNPENDFNLTVLRLLVLLSHLSGSVRTGKLILTKKRLVLYDYLITRPSMLNSLLESAGAHKAETLGYESTDIRRKSLYGVLGNYKLDISLSVLLANEMASSSFSGERGIVYSSTQLGRAVLGQIETKFVKRLHNRAKSMTIFQAKREEFLTTELSKII